MKIKQEDYETLSKAIEEVVRNFPIATLEHYAANGLSPMRFRWDCLHKAGQMGYLPDGFLCKVLYAYANDDHIDTALRRITNTN